MADGDGLRRALAALPLEQARAVVLAAVHGYTAREIADQERIPLGTAKTRIRAAVGKLHAALSTDTGPCPTRIALPRRNAATASSWPRNWRCGCCPGGTGRG